MPNGTATILSIDGGGIRGLIPARVLAYLEERTGRPVASLFDLIAGSSTGGLLALGLTKPTRRGADDPRYAAAELAALYEKEGPRIFRRSLWRRITSANSFLGVKYPSAPLEAMLKEYLQASRLQDALTNVLVTAYELERRTAFFFKSHRAQADPHRDFFMWQAAFATAAAPTYFAPIRIAAPDEVRPYTLIDGGVYANNPAMCAYAEARTLFPEADRLFVLSLGTGEQTRPLPYEKTRNWGQLEWAQPILDVVFHGISDTVDYQLRQVLAEDRGAYHRFQVRLDLASDDFDDASDENLAALDRQADRLLSERRAELDAVCDQLLALQDRPV